VTGPEVERLQDIRHRVDKGLSLASSDAVFMMDLVDSLQKRLTRIKVSLESIKQRVDKALSE